MSFIPFDHLIAAGSQAPSGDNVQAWSFIKGSDCLHFFIDEKRQKSFFNPNDFASKVSCGAVIENISLRAQELGFETTLVSSESFAHIKFYVCTFEFKKSTHQNYNHLSREISKRHTNRSLYLPKVSVENEKLAKIEIGLDSFRNHQVKLFTPTSDRKLLTRALFLADLVRFSHKDCHNSFFKNLNFVPRNEGLNFESLGISELFRPAMKFLKPWETTHACLKFGLHYLMSYLGTHRPLASAPVLGAIIENGDHSPLELGQCIQRLWLEATALGLSFQPFMLLPIFLYRLELEGSACFSSGQLKTLEKSRSLLVQLKESREIEGHFRFFFRLGYAKKEVPTSTRREVDSYLLKNIEIPASKVA